MHLKSLSSLAQDHDTDKSQSPGYIENYERHFGHLRDRPVNVLEFGVLNGGSLLLWRDHFPLGNIVGLDTRPNPLNLPPDRVRFYQGSQDDAALLARIAAECAPGGFDVIIDDCAHVGDLSRASFMALFEHHLASGGLYVVEDWGTGYWPVWQDGALYTPGVPHHAGMVGFVKELIDEVGYADAIAPGRGNAALPARSSRIKSMSVYFGQVFIERSDA